MGLSNNPVVLGGVGLTVPSGTSPVGTAGITSTQVAYGDTAANTIKGEAAFTYNDSTNTLSVDTITPRSGVDLAITGAANQAVNITAGSGNQNVTIATTGTGVLTLTGNTIRGSRTDASFPWEFAGSGSTIALNTTSGSVGMALGFNSTSKIRVVNEFQILAGVNETFGGAASAVTTATKLIKAVTAIADNTATAVLTVTIPNAAHSASLRVRLAGSLGAGGAIGANEATGVISYDFAIARTAGVNAVVGAATATGSATAAVAGAATITITAAASAISGAVGASNTFTVNVTIARGSGSSDNHTCLVVAEVMNANASGISIA